MPMTLPLSSFISEMAISRHLGLSHPTHTHMHATQ